MKNVRIFYTKTDRMRFVSHLDMNRFMSRMLKKAEIPIWYTEGFHPHPYIVFGLPLSLGFESEYEILDIRLTDDDYPIENVCTALNRVFPEYVRALRAAEPVLKTGKIAFARFEITFADTGEISPALEKFLNRQSILCSKTTKRGTVKEIDLIPKIKEWKTAVENRGTKLYLTLPAGSEDNLNPELLLNAFFEQDAPEYATYSIVRTQILDPELKLFV